MSSVQQSFEKLISLAIKREDEAYEFYTKAAENAEQVSSKKLLIELARQEEGHKKKLQSALGEGLCDTFTCETIEELEEMDLSQYLTDVPLKPSSSSQDILIVAIKREEGAFEFYKALSELTGDPSHRAVFETLAGEEKKHKELLESIYDERIQPWM
ncbi:MAG: ferritin family protein [Candidatus Thorarchaeota archaeon]|nr:MAG: ferritin family protein [Candidatus Thorarchaeota archaeon]